MPSFSCPSSIRVASQDHALRLKITHNLVHGPPSETTHSIQGRLPKELDVLWLSDIIFSFSGFLDGRRITAHDMAHSGLVHHLETRLKANANQLGLNNVSRPFIDDEDGLSKRRRIPLTSLLVSNFLIQVTLTPSRPLPLASRPHANLVSLHLSYIWSTTGRNDIVNSGYFSEEMNPFSPVLFLPVEALLNRLIEQFLIYHLVGRYPLIFGRWCKRLDQEMQYFPSISRSIVAIMNRSKNPRFLSKCRGLIKIAHKYHKFVLQSSAAALSSCTDDGPCETSAETSQEEMKVPDLTNEHVLCESLEQLFRAGVPRRRFKPAETLQFVSLRQDEEEDEDNILQNIPAAGVDDDDAWMELSGIAMPPCTHLGEPPQLLPMEDEDATAAQDRFEDEAWSLCNDILDDREFGAQSNESLISTSVPLTSITTRCTQACSFTLYHHMNVDDHEPGPACSGLRHDILRLAHLEEPGTCGLPANHTHLPSHGSHDHHRCEQVMQDPGTRRPESELLARGDPSYFQGNFEDSDWILSDGEGGIDASRRSADAADVTVWDLELLSM